jgi:hypothetical protein
LIRTGLDRGELLCVDSGQLFFPSRWIHLSSGPTRVCTKRQHPVVLSSLTVLVMCLFSGMDELEDTDDINAAYVASLPGIGSEFRHWRYYQRSALREGGHGSGDGGLKGKPSDVLQHLQNCTRVSGSRMRPWIAQWVVCSKLLNAVHSTPLRMRHLSFATHIPVKGVAAVHTVKCPCSSAL